MKKRILSILLTAIMLLSLVPMTVSASETVTLSGTISSDSGYDSGTGDFFYISRDVIYDTQTVTVQIALKNTQNGIGTFGSDNIDIENSVILVGFGYIWFEEVATNFVGNANGLTGSIVGKDGNTYDISFQKSTPVYTVAGASDLMGSEWDPTDNANNMTDMGDGSFQLVKENVVLPAGDYMYKVASDHKWGTGDYPQDGGNKTLTIAENGTYTVTFTLVPANADLSATADKLSYKYTEYENWQINYGNRWEWSGNMEKVEDGLFKLEIYWEGTGINVKSDEKPIKKDWFAPEELILGEEVIAPVNVDAYLKVIDDETVMIGVGVIPEAPAPASYTYSVKFPKGPEQVYIIGNTSNWATFTPMTMTSDTTATITVDTQFTAYKYTAGANWDYVEKDAQGGEISNRTAYADPDIVGSWAAVPAPAWPEDAPTTAPAAPAHGGASIIGAAQTTDYAFEPQDWPGAQPVKLTYATGETIYYMDKMTWQIYTNWAEDSYDMSQYGTLHIDLFPATGTEIKITFEGLTVDDGGQGYKNSVVKTLTAGQWNGLDIALSEFPALSSGDAYDFSDIRYLILEGYNAEQTALSVGNVYFHGNTSHTHNLVKVNGQAATKTAAGFKDYYECKDSTDACHKYFEDASGLVEITDLDAWKAQGGKGYIAPLGDKKIITEISLSLTEYTRDNISFTSIPYPEAKITGITEGNEDVKLETGYIYFFDKDGKWIYSCLLSGPEAKPVWYDMSSYKAGKDGMEGEKVIDTAPDYSKIKKAIVNVLATSKNGFAPELKVTVNGKALGVSKMVEGTYNADTMVGYQVMEQDAYFFVPFDIVDSTTSPKTGDNSHMALWVMLLALSSTGLCACLVLGKKRKNVQ